MLADSRSRKWLGIVAPRVHARRLAGSAALLCAVLFPLVAGCGGGGGSSAAPADVRGRVLLTTTGQPPNPAATVSISGAAAVQTLADGSFTVRSASSAATVISITAAGMAALNQALPALTANTVNDLGDIYLTDTTYNATVDGVVVRADTLAPIAGARVRLSGLRTTTAADGSFVLAKLPVGLGGLGLEVGMITATGFEDKPIIIDLPLGATAPPDNLVNHLGEILVSPPVGGIPGGPTTIRGKVTLEGLTSYGGTTVTLVRASDNTDLGWVSSGDDGSYGFWVPTGQYRVRAERTGYTSKTVDVNLVRLDQPVTTNIHLGF